MGLILQAPLGFCSVVTLLMSIELTKNGLTYSRLAYFPSSRGRGRKLILLGCSPFRVKLQQMLRPPDSQMMDDYWGRSSSSGGPCVAFLNILVTCDCSRCSGFLSPSCCSEMLGLLLHSMELDRLLRSLPVLAYLGSERGAGRVLASECAMQAGRTGVRWVWLEKQRWRAGVVTASSCPLWPLFLRFRLLALPLRSACEPKVMFCCVEHCLCSTGREQAQGLSSLLMRYGTTWISLRTVLKLLCTSWSLSWPCENFFVMSFLRYFQARTLGTFPSVSSSSSSGEQGKCEYSSLLYFLIFCESQLDSARSRAGLLSSREWLFSMEASSMGALLLGTGWWGGRGRESSGSMWAVGERERSRSGSMWFLLRLQRLTVEFSSFSCSVMQQLELSDCVAWLLIRPRLGQNPLNSPPLRGRRGLNYSRSDAYWGSRTARTGGEGLANLMVAAWEGAEGTGWALGVGKSSWRSCWYSLLFLLKRCWCWWLACDILFYCAHNAPYFPQYLTNSPFLPPTPSLLNRSSAFTHPPSLHYTIPPYLCGPVAPLPSFCRVGGVVCLVGESARRISD